MSTRLYLKRPSDAEAEIVEEILDTLNKCRDAIENDPPSGQLVSCGATFVEECIVEALCELGFGIVEGEPLAEEVDFGLPPVGADNMASTY